VEKLPLDYSPEHRKQYSKAAIAAIIASVFAGPVGALSERLATLPEPLFWIARFLPAAVSLLIAIAAIIRIEKAYDQRLRADTIKGAWVAYLAVLVTILSALALLAAPM
jgi:hypothetical protein